MKKLICILFLVAFPVFGQTVKSPANLTGGAVSLTTTSAQSAAVDLDGRAIVEVDMTCTVDCFVAIGDNPTAVVCSGGDSSKACYFLSAAQTYRHNVPRNSKIAGIVSSGTGTLYFHIVK